MRSWDEDKHSWPHAAHSCFVRAAGIHWHVQRMGQGPNLLLVHGTGASTHSWRDLMPLLAERYSVLAPDLPGHAFTDAANGAQSSIAGMSGALAALLRELRVAPDYCVGHSAGAVVLCRMALDGYIAPRAIVSINGAFVPLAGAAGRWFAPVARFLASTSFTAQLIAKRARTTRASVERLIVGTGSTLDEAGIELYARLVGKPEHVAGALRMMGGWDLNDFAKILPQLTVPLTLIVGNNDRMVPPAQALAVRDRLQRAQVRPLPGLGHLAHEENPRLLAQEIFDICRH